MACTHRSDFNNVPRPIKATKLSKTERFENLQIFAVCGHHSDIIDYLDQSKQKFSKTANLKHTQIFVVFGHHGDVIVVDFIRFSNSTALKSQRFNLNMFDF